MGGNAKYHRAMDRSDSRWRCNIHKMDCFAETPATSTGSLNISIIYMKVNFIGIVFRN